MLSHKISKHRQNIFQFCGINSFLSLWHNETKAKEHKLWPGQKMLGLFWSLRPQYSCTFTPLFGADRRPGVFLELDTLTPSVQDTPIGPHQPSQSITDLLGMWNVLNNKSKHRHCLLSLRFMIHPIEHAHFSSNRYFSYKLQTARPTCFRPSQPVGGHLYWILTDLLLSF